jgi:hypothetical protein
MLVQFVEEQNENLREFDIGGTTLSVYLFEHASNMLLRPIREDATQLHVTSSGFFMTLWCYVL